MADVKTLAKRLLPEFALDVAVTVRRYRRAHGHWPNLVRPRTFTEKIVWRNLFDGDPLLRRLSDKVAARAWVAASGVDVRLPELYWRTVDPRDIPYAALPDAFVVKANHGSGWVKIVHEKAGLDVVALTAACQSWLGVSYHSMTRERVYRGIRPQILVEELLSSRPGVLAEDYKFFVFAGKARYLTHTIERFADIRCTFYDPDWNLMPVKFADVPGLAEPRPRPPRLAQMTAVAEALGADFNFVRVDLYDTPSAICFGEMSVSPFAGLTPFIPASFDDDLGACWSAPLRSRRR